MACCFLALMAMFPRGALVVMYAKNGLTGLVAVMGSLHALMNRNACVKKMSVQ